MLQNGAAFDFYQAVRLLDRLTGAGVCRPPLRDEGDAGAGAPRARKTIVRRRARPKGATHKAQASHIRIRPDLNLDYPQSNVAAIHALDEDKGYEVLTTFMGLYGVSSPLPGFITEELLDDEWEEQPAAREFIDIIHYHLYPLLYQAWLKYRFVTNVVEGEDARYREIIYSLMGLGEAFRDDEEVAGRLLPFAGIMAQGTRSQTGLKTLLTASFPDLPIDIEPCIERQVGIHACQRCRLGGRNHQLGEDAVIGQQVADRAGAFAVHIGPLHWRQYRELGVDSQTIAGVADIIRLYLVQPLDYEIRLHIEADSIPPLQLGAEDRAILGQSGWLGEVKDGKTLQVTYHADQLRQTH